MQRRELFKLAGAGFAGLYGREALGIEAVSGPDSYAFLADYVREASEEASLKYKGNPLMQEAYLRQILMVLSGSTASVLGASLKCPRFVPFIPYYTPYLGPNPDTCYGITPIDPDGIYRVYGRRGTETIAGLTLRDGGPHLGRLNGKRISEIAAKDIADENQEFSFVLSRKRPSLSGAEKWFELKPEVRCAMSRRVVKGVDYEDGEWRIERLDEPKVGQTYYQVGLPEQAAITCAKTTNQFLSSYVERLHDEGARSRFVPMDQRAYGGLIDQIYYFHLFKLKENEMLLIESEVPEAVYWNVQVLDPFISGLDFANYQTNLNDNQAVLDTDGKVRMVLSTEDPGIHNWLDTRGWREGVLIWRWNGVAMGIEPTIEYTDYRHFDGEFGGAVAAPARARQLAARRRLYRKRPL